MLHKRFKLIFPIAVCITFILLAISPVANASGAKVDITPTSLPLGGTITIVIQPFVDVEAFVLVAGPFDQEMNELSDFHAQYIMPELTANVEYTYDYPGDPDDWENIEGAANTGSVGTYLVLVALTDGEFDLDDIDDYFGDWTGLMGYFVSNFETVIQLTIVRVHVIPESIIGTAAGATIPIIALTSAKLYKRRRK